MDVTTFVAFLVPLLPYLAKGAAGAAEAVGKNIGSAVWEKAHAMWQALHPKVNSTPGLQEVLADVEKNPADEGARNALVYHMGKLFKADPALKTTLERLWQETDQQAVRTVIASGERAVAAGGDITGSVNTGTMVGTKERTGGS
jgi:hypothetical protein